MLKLPRLLWLFIVVAAFLGFNSPPSLVQAQGGRTIAFIRDGDIWLLDTVTGSQTQLTSESEYVYLDWSPDGGKMIALTSENEIHVVGPNLNEVKLIERASASLPEHPIWSPDNQKIAYISDDGQGARMRVKDINGQAVYNHNHFAYPMFWDETGAILFFADPLGLYQVNLDNGQPSAVYEATQSFLVSKGYYSDASERFAAWEYLGEGFGELAILKLDGNYLKVSASGEPTGDWSPDGNRFVFQTGNTSFAQAEPISIYDLQNKKITEVVKEGGLNPRWSPDGTTIAFTTWKGGLSLLKVGTGEISPLLPDAKDEYLHEYRSWGGNELIGFFVTPEWESKWSSDGQQLIFNYPNGFYIVSVPDGTSQWVDNATSPQWRPGNLNSSSLENGLIAYVGTDSMGNAIDIRLVDPDGSGMQIFPLDDTAPEEYIPTCWPAPKFSPDGKYLGFVRSRFSERIIEQPNGQQNIIKSPEEPEELVVADLQGEVKSAIDDFGLAFDWSPDSISIVHGRNIDWNESLRPAKAEGLWRTDIFSGEDQLLISPSSGFPLTSPKWSPDNTHIAFHEVVYGEGIGPFGVAEIDGSNYKVWNRQVGFFDWSPDGNEIVFDDLLYSYDAGISLFLANVDGSNERILLSDGRFITIDPHWSPNGRYIAFLNMKDEAGTLWVIKPDGSDLRQISDTSLGRIGFISWSPNGQQIVASSDNGMYVISLDGSPPVHIGQGLCPDWQKRSEPAPPNLYTISGRVIDFNTEDPLPDVVISDGLDHTVSTDGDGNFTLTGLITGTYTLTPSKSDYLFSPSSRTVNVPPDAGGQDFTGSGDLDGDGLYDIWEIQGYDADGDGIVDVDLPAMGADPNHKDIYVEVDYMVEQECVLDVCFDRHSHRPNPDSIAIVVGAFRNAPVSNIDGVHGIDLHVDFGSDTPMNSVENWGSYSRSNRLPHDDDINWEDFYALKQANLDPARQDIFHYAIFAHFLEGTVCVTGASRGRPAMDFIVTLGGWGGPPILPGEPAPCFAPIRRHATGTLYQQAGTFMHELGHNLGLHHGGGDSINGKPNYLSVMNYAFQTRGLIYDGNDRGAFDYSRSDQIPVLRESDLNETTGLFGGSSTGGYGTRWMCPNGNENHTLDANSPIDWNCNENTDETSISVNLNNGWEEDPSPPDESLSGYFDWENITYLVLSDDVTRSANQGAFYESFMSELSLEVDEQIPDSYDIGLFGSSGLVAPPGYTSAYTITLVNTGENPDTYRLVVTSSNGWADEASVPDEVTLEPGEIQALFVPVKIPSTANQNDTDTLKITVSSTGNPALWSSFYATTVVDVRSSRTETADRHTGAEDGGSDSGRVDESDILHPSAALWLPYLILFSGLTILLVSGIGLAIRLRKKPASYITRLNGRVDPEGKYCMNCGANLPEQGQYCPQCGAPRLKSQGK